MSKHCVVQMTVTTVNWPYVFRMIPELFTLDGQKFVFFDFENKKGWAFGPPLG